MNTDQAASIGSIVGSDDARTYYTLQGMKVDAPQQPGIYIRQGRKEFIQ